MSPTADWPIDWLKLPEETIVRVNRIWKEIMENGRVLLMYELVADDVMDFWTRKPWSVKMEEKQFKTPKYKNRITQEWQTIDMEEEYLVDNGPSMPPLEESE